MADYPARVRKLQHLGGRSSEFQIHPNTGSHVVTAYVDLPESEENSVLEWAGENNTALMDILLLLSLFGGREVFAGPPGTDGFGSGVILRDPRIYRWGGVLRSSIPYKGTPDRARPPVSDVFDCNVGFEEAIDRMYALIRSKEWQQKYKRGYFLFLARQAFHRQTLESAFVQCWTVWEHLFTIHNRSWMSERRIRHLSGGEKVAFLFTEYDLVSEVDARTRAAIQERLSQTRNRLIHFGRFPEYDEAHDDADLFIRLTEVILAKILGLTPSNVFNTGERLEQFLGRGED